MPRNDLIQFRKGTTAQWAEADEASATDSERILAQGEPGLDTDLQIVKIGDGVSTWAELPYANEGILSATLGIKDNDPARPIDSNNYVKLQSSHDNASGMVIWTQKTAGDSTDVNIDGSVIVKHGKNYAATPGYADTVQFYTLAGSSGTIIGNNDYQGYESTLPYAPGPAEVANGFIRFELGPIWPRSEVMRLNNQGDLLLGRVVTNTGGTYTQTGTTVTAVTGEFAASDVGKFHMWRGKDAWADRITAFIDSTHVTVETSREISTAEAADTCVPKTLILKDSTIQTYDGLKVKARNGQTSSLQEWQNSGGDAIVRVTPYQLVFGPQVADPSADVHITTLGNAEKGLVIRGFSGSQSANMFETQASNGALTFAIDKAGTPHWADSANTQDGATTGTADFLPSRPVTYLKVLHPNGTPLVIPAYYA